MTIRQRTIEELARLFEGRKEPVESLLSDLPDELLSEVHAIFSEDIWEMKEKEEDEEQAIEEAREYYNSQRAI